jgi:small basic protein (TIGR04137 family)
MSLDPSLKSASSLVRHRNVLTRGERLEKLADLGKWNDEKSPLGLVKVGNRKQVMAGKEKTDATATTPAVAGAPAAGAAGAKGAAPAAGAKAAAPAAGAKAAAPAAKPAGKK